MDQVQANILELAGNFLLETREADGKFAHSLTEVQRDKEGQVPLSLQSWVAFTYSPTSRQSLMPWAAEKSNGEAAALDPVSEGKVWVEKEETDWGRGLLEIIQKETT